MPIKGNKGLVIAAVILTGGRSYPCRLLTKHLIQISTKSLFFGHVFAIDDTASIISSTKNMWTSQKLTMVFGKTA